MACYYPEMHQALWWSRHVGVGPIIIYLVPLLLLGEHLRTAFNPLSDRILGMTLSTFNRTRQGLLVIALLGATLLTGRILVRTVVTPPQWDFQALWMYGMVADSGQNPYLPGPYQASVEPGPLVEGFQEEVLNVGAVYPPPTLLLFGTIGRLPLRTAIFPWMIVQTLAFLGMVVLLWRNFLPQSGGEGLALVFTMALLLPATIATFGHGQVNFLAVLCVLAAMQARNRFSGGVYLVGAAILKLLYGALWLYPLLRWRRRPVIGIALASVIAMAASAAVFGRAVVATYLYDNPVTHRMPSYYFSTYVNQSLLGESLRLAPYHMPAFGPPMRNFLYLISAAIVGFITVWLVVRLPRTQANEDTAFNLLILAGMLIYPWTISNYFVLLLVPMGFLWARRSESPIGFGWTLFLISAVYPITYFANGSYAIVATLLLWAAIVWIAALALKDSSRNVAPDSVKQPTLAIS